MQKKENISLKPFNTFHIDQTAKCLYVIEDVGDIKKLIHDGLFKEKFFILGGGSNTLFSKDFDGNIIKISISGKEILDEKDNKVRVKVSAGENFTSFVEWTVKNNLSGIQNLAWIPGSVGATPVQNVGAYGTEIKDVLEFVEYIDLETGDIQTISNADCGFGYRDSIFKHELKNKIIILSLILKLEKSNPNLEIPEIYLGYGDISRTLEENEQKPYTLKKVYDAVCTIRKQKLPDINIYGSCGSTFENPLITIKQYNKLQKEYPDLPSFSTDKQDYVKIPAAYILERLGWKNKRIGECGTWTHPLIVTNYGNASAQEILDVISKIQEDFYRNTEIKLATEINII